MKQFLNRNFYKWHRILGLIALVPIIGWTISGLSHPFMSNWFRPHIAKERYELSPQSELKPILTLAQVMDQNHITEIRNYGLIGFNHHTYYQILQKDSVYNYYSATDGQLLSNADPDYAIYLARYFTQDSISKIKPTIQQKNFDGQYQPINRLLPVWKVSFDRPDCMDVYIETGQSRMSTFNNNTRKNMLWFFEQLHTWDFLAALLGNQVRLIIMFAVVAVLFLSLLSGIIVYGLFWKRFKEIAQKRKAKGQDDKRWVHRYHRQLGLGVSFLMLMFFVSAGFHIWVKMRDANPGHAPYEYLIKRSDLQVDNLHLPIADSLVKKQSVIKMFETCYYQITDNNKNILYYNTADGKLSKDCDREYADYLAYYYRPRDGYEGKHATLRATPVRQFTNEYGFINKRLPVQLVSYPGKDNWYIETGTSQLAAHVAGIDRTEGLSFIFLHKFFWMTWAGKNVRDVVSMLAALGVLLVALLGFAAFIKNK